MSLAVRLYGAPVAEQLCSKLQRDVARLKAQGVVPGLGMVRVGDRPADLRYEQGAMKRAEGLGIAVSRTLLPEDVPERVLLEMLRQINQNDRIHGCLLFRPLPEQLNTPAVMSALQTQKDIDAMTGISIRPCAEGGGAGFLPCTAAACLALLRHYQLPLRGRHIVVVGTGQTVGLPTALMLMEAGATVSTCNIFTKPEQLEWLCREADIIISAAGKAKLIGAQHVRPGQILVDIGMSPDENGQLCGDVDVAAVETIVAGYAPVFGGVSAVTSTILAQHTVQAALRAAGLPEKAEEASHARINA